MIVIVIVIVIVNPVIGHACGKSSCGEKSWSLIVGSDQFWKRAWSGSKNYFVTETNNNSTVRDLCRRNAWYNPNLEDDDGLDS